MSKIWKRVFCSFLAAVMLFAVVPIQAFAADEESVVETTEVLETTEEVTEETEAPTDYFEEPTVATEEVIVAEEPEEEVWEEPFVDVVQEQAVRFLCSMEDLILAVYDSNGEFVRSDENDPTLYWLLPGIYCYEAACAGYETDSGEFEVFNEPLNVEVTLMAETAEEPTETTEETEPVPEETVEIIPEEVLAPAETEEEFEFGEIEYDEYTDELGRTISFEGMEVPDDFDPSLIATYGADVGYYVPVNSMDEAGDYVRSLMVDREEKIQFSYRDLSGGISSSNVKSILYDIIDEALKHTGSPIEGDYLRWH